jgi:hypothetical protein
MHSSEGGGIAQQVEGGAMSTLEGVAEQLSF